MNKTIEFNKQEELKKVRQYLQEKYCEDGEEFLGIKLPAECTRDLIDFLLEQKSIPLVNKAHLVYFWLAVKQKEYGFIDYMDTFKSLIPEEDSYWDDYLHLFIVDFISNKIVEWSTIRRIEFDLIRCSSEDYNMFADTKELVSKYIDDKEEELKFAYELSNDYWDNFFDYLQSINIALVNAGIEEKEVE